MKRIVLAALLTSPVGAEPLPPGFVHLSRVAPQIAQDIRYARDFNFIGAPVPGYDAAECILTTNTAQALIRVEARLAEQGFGLVVYDCYRPKRAVAHFARWATQSEPPDHRPPGVEPAGDTPPEAPTPAQVFYPDLTRNQLIPGGYIARRSGHSVGHTVDVSLRLKGTAVPLPDFPDAGRCDAPQHNRADEGLDMGTAYDCFSSLSADKATVSREAQSNRKVLTRAMEAEGFRGYAKEWWHFRNTTDPSTKAHDFPVSAP
ncbi:MAG: M15 family metallopeptidase [Pseudotabrizicola sp.]|uniref:M15 family metallopeptidase n=1 Tax=Pseudotabrizicola sp. TaxID=2939647 RepID=UPI0027301215|nr:M15 family metallopeptidase [Pseudotabrizicola sp.]MDP2082811.1 M15 family metallopeptidase [Pseudotabrizicola sp.]MDZ7576216.1 M15 family metallopeptidase [Pseudotabrizicola sp.]